MKAHKLTLTAFASAALIASWAIVGSGQAKPQPPATTPQTSGGALPLEPIRDRGQGVTGAYEGWYRNPDGSFTMLVGYFNRNRTETLDIPVGPNNQITPGGPDRGQPTHFLPRRQWGVFTVKVPADFPTGSKLVWTIVANGEKNEIPLTLHTNYEVMPFKDPAMGNTPPVLKMQAAGEAFQGPPTGVMAATMTATVGQPMPLEFFATDDAHEEPGDQLRGTAGRGRGGRGEPPAPVTVVLSKFRGPGEVKFENARPPVNWKGDGKVATTATFSAPGDYVLRVQANDNSGEGGGGFQCCWTNVHVAVAVK
jgi:hypothetical protein